MARSKKEKPAKKSAIHDVVTRDYTIRTNLSLLPLLTSRHAQESLRREFQKTCSPSNQSNQRICQIAYGIPSPSVPETDKCREQLMFEWILN